jgi:hypothetical protein
MQKFFALFCFLGLCLGSLTLNAQEPAPTAPTAPTTPTGRTSGTGVLTGTVLDGDLREPLIGAVVKVDKLERATQTDAEGRYRIEGIPQGTYSVRASYLGYRTAIQFEIRIESGTRTLDFELASADTNQATVEIEASPYEKTATNIVSTRSIGTEQILSNPGGNNDISRVVQSLPGVGAPIGFRNDIIIRGGAPNENVFYLDGIEVPNINHFATQGSGGGPVGIINANFISRVNFAASAFEPRFDNTLSSVLDFEFLEGNKEGFQTVLQVSATDAGITFDTPLNRKRTATGIFSVRRSYLDGLFQLIGLPFLPAYWDTQFKIKWDINPKTSITFIHLGAIDRFRLNDPKNLDTTQLNIQYGLDQGFQNTYTFGAILKRTTKRGFFTLALSRNWLQNVSRRDSIDSEGYRIAPRLANFESQESENKLRFNQVTILGKWRLNYGGVLQLARYQVDAFTTFKTALDDSTVVTDTLRPQADMLLGRVGFHVGVSRTFFNNRILLNFGLRTDMNTFTKRGWNFWETLSPRASASFKLLKGLTLNTSAGLYYKLPPYVLLGYRDLESGRYTNRDMRYTMNVHAVLGLEYLINPSTVVSVEGFFKYYDNYPVSLRDGVSLANRGGSFALFGNEPVTSVGEGRAYGFEVFFQKRLTERWYGTLSYTFFYSEFTGLNRATGKSDGRFVRSAWDNRHLLTLLAGVLLGKNKSWELSGRLRLLDGFPWTPYDVPSSTAQFLLNGIAVEDATRLNQNETSVFTQLDIRVDKKFFFKKWSLNLYLDIQNLLQPLAERLNLNTAPDFFTLARDPKNPSQFIRPARPLILQNFQGTILPSIGIRVKFLAPYKKAPVE